MKILWITNTLFPEAMSMIGPHRELRASGGWMLGAASSLIEQENLTLGVATVSKEVSHLTELQGEKIKYFIIPYGRGNNKINREYENFWREIKDRFNPDIVHIHGTEFSHGYSYVAACGNENVVVSIQGLKSAYHYYDYGLSIAEILLNIAPLDLYTGTIISQKKKFKKQGEIEKKIIKSVKYIIGRTSWDYSRIKTINPNVKYLFCNEVLRPEFYSGNIWNYDGCIKHQIFLSQAGYPIKGLHQLLRALPIIRNYYPDVKVRIAGNDITKTSSLHDWIRFTGYGRIVKSMIKKLKLEDVVIFLGPLNAEEMIKEYLSANVFVCPSSIENSPNSLGEAQIIGTPHIASYVGGIPDMMKGNEGNLYRFEEYEMLAFKVCEIFRNKSIQTDMREAASLRHSQIRNTNHLIEIYQNILNN